MIDGREHYNSEKDTPLPPEIEHIYPDYSLYPEQTKDTALITVKPDGHEPVQVDTYYGGGGEGCYLDSGYSLCDEATAWRPLPKPYTEEES